MAYYIGADAGLKKLDFDNKNPSLHTTELGADEQIVKSHFSTENVLYIGSSHGCGCGFKHALYEKENVWYDVMSEDIPKEKETRKSQLQLIEYVKSALKFTDRVELFLCWEGNVQAKPLLVECFNVNDLENEEFYFKENGFYIIM